jgi:excisionase family DNA binding protein
MGDALFSIPEAAKRLGGVSPWTIRAWLHQGRMRKTKVGGRTMIAESEILRFLESCSGETHIAPKAKSLQKRGRSSGAR